VQELPQAAIFCRVTAGLKERYKAADQAQTCISLHFRAAVTEAQT